MSWIEFLLVGAASGLVFPVAFRAAREWRVRAAELGALLGVLSGALVWLGGAHDSATLATALWASLSFSMVGGWVLMELGSAPAGPAAQLAGVAGPTVAAEPPGPIGDADTRSQVEQADHGDAPRHVEPPRDQEPSGDAEPAGDAESLGDAEPVGDAEPPQDAGGG